MRSINKTSVCVVGGAGFLGSHLVDYLIEKRDCRVLVVDNLCVGRREFIHPKASFLHHDITASEDYFLSALLDHNCRYVFNYAAYPYIPDSFARPMHVANVNFFGAMKVINAAETAGVDAILQVSSAEIYGEGARVPKSDPAAGYESRIDGKIAENAVVAPHSTYGASKAAIDYYCQARWREAKVPVIALRQFNCVGERETHPYVVPEIISQLARHTVQTRGNVCELCGLPMPADELMFRYHGLTETCEEARIRCGGSAVRPPAKISLGNNSARDFMYAGDAVTMAVELLERGSFGEVYNLGSESSVKIYDLARIVGKLMGFSDVQIEQDSARVRPWEIWHLQSDNTKIHQAVSHRPAVTLEEALRRTVEYYRRTGSWCWDSGELLGIVPANTPS